MNAGLTLILLCAVPLRPVLVCVLPFLRASELSGLWSIDMSATEFWLWLVPQGLSRNKLLDICKYSSTSPGSVLIVTRKLASFDTPGMFVHNKRRAGDMFEGYERQHKGWRAQKIHIRLSSSCGVNIPGKQVKQPAYGCTCRLDYLSAPARCRVMYKGSSDCAAFLPKAAILAIYVAPCCSIVWHSTTSASATVCQNVLPRSGAALTGLPKVR